MLFRKTGSISPVPLLRTKPQHILIQQLKEQLESKGRKDTN